MEVSKNFKNFFKNKLSELLMLLIKDKLILVIIN